MDRTRELKRETLYQQHITIRSFHINSTRDFVVIFAELAHTHPSSSYVWHMSPCKTFSPNSQLFRRYWHAHFPPATVASHAMRLELPFPPKYYDFRFDRFTWLAYHNYILLLHVASGISGIHLCKISTWVYAIFPVKCWSQECAISHAHECESIVFSLNCFHYSLMCFKFSGNAKGWKLESIGYL